MEMMKLEDLKILGEQLSHQGIKYLQDVPPTQWFGFLLVPVLTTIVLLFTSAVRFIKRKSNTVLLSGLSGSGKTVLFYQLRDGSSHQGTTTSMELNEGTFVLHSENTENQNVKIQPIHLVDVPGNSQVEEFLPRAAAIVFVVDALEFLPNCRAASEYLYDILTNANVVNKKIPVLLCCNKTDRPIAHTNEFIRKQMEKEIEKLRASRSAVSTADIANDLTTGIIGEVFSFSHCSNKVTLAEASGLTGETVQVKDFIGEYI